MEEMNSGSPEGRRSRVIVALLLLGVLVVTLIVHLPVLSAQATSFDDERYLVDDPLVENPGWQSVGAVFSEVLKPSYVRGYYHPVSIITLMMDCAMGGRMDDLRPFHRTSLLLHLGSTALVTVLLYQLFGNPWAAAAFGLLFGIHPLTVEPVAWIAARRGLLAGTLGLGCLVLYARYARQQDRKTYAACLVVYGLALLSRPTSVPLPALMLIMDYWPLRRLNRHALIEKIPFFVLGAVSAKVAVISEGAGLAVLPDHSAIRVGLTACYKIMFYLSKIAWPVNLSSCYAAPAPLSMANPVVAVAVLGFGILIAAAVISLRWTRSLAAGGLFFIVALFPGLGLFKYSEWVFACDNYVYLPAAGILMALAAGFKWSLNRVSGLGKPFWPRAVFALAVLGIGLTEGVASRRYLSCWRDSETLVRHMLSLDPNNARLLDCMGLTLQRQGRVQEAIGYCTRAIQANPTGAYLHNDLGIVYARQHRLAESVEQFRLATTLEPAYVDFHSNLGNALLLLDQPGEAVAAFQRELDLRPGYAKAELGLTRALAMLGRTDEAMSLYRQAVRQQYPGAPVHCDLGDLLFEQGNAAAAIECYSQARLLKPHSMRVLHGLSWLLATTEGIDREGREQAVVLAERLVQQAGPKNPGALDTLAAAYAAAGRYPEAVQTAQKAIDLDSASGRPDLAKQIQIRLDAYKAGRPYRESALPSAQPADRPPSP